MPRALPVISLIAVLALAACARPLAGPARGTISPPASTTGIVNGTDADPATDARAATVAAVEVSVRGGTGGCTGTVIAPRVVLTAAHCLENALDVRVRFAASPVVGRVANWRSHPEYLALFKQRKSAQDVALIRLKTSVPKAVRIARLAAVSTTLAPGTAVTSYGYGLDTAITDRNSVAARARSKPSRPILKKGSFQVVELGGSVFKTQAQERALCHGDSGGPAFLEAAALPVLVGVNSFGSNNRCVNALNGVADMRAARDWIDLILRRWGSSAED